MGTDQGGDRFGNHRTGGDTAKPGDKRQADANRSGQGSAQQPAQHGGPDRPGGGGQQVGGGNNNVDRGQDAVDVGTSGEDKKPGRQ